MVIFNVSIRPLSFSDAQETFTYWNSKKAKKGASPGRFVALISPGEKTIQQNRQIPIAMRRQIYDAVTAGAKGIMYRLRRKQHLLDHELSAVLAKTNAELKQMSEILAIAEPWQVLRQEEALIHRMRAGVDREIIVLVRDNVVTQTQIKMHVLDGVIPKQCYRLSGSERIPCDMNLLDDDNFRITIPESAGNIVPVVIEGELANSDSRKGVKH